LPGVARSAPGIPPIYNSIEERTVDNFMDLMWVLKQFGPLLIAVIFFLWRDYRREDRLVARIETLEDQQQDVLLPLVEKCSTVIAQNTVIMQRLERALDK
jgi:hypothetical protein